MSNQKKNIQYSLVLCLIVGLVWFYRNYISPKSTETVSQKNSTKEKLFVFTGKTMGTTYTIKYLNNNELPLKKPIDSLLQNFNQSLSTYIPTSEISRFNEADSFEFILPYFHAVLQTSSQIYEQTEGAFDPTVMPLVNAWGFGPEKKATMNQKVVDSLLQFVGFEYIKFDQKKVFKTRENVQLDFSALAKGYGVDVVSRFLVSKGIQHFLVEIGGEVFAKGHNPKGKKWTLGIDDPTKNASSNQASGIVLLQDRALATSGNYRNFYIKDGKKYAHTIHPKTGYPVQHRLLSASVFATNCMVADGYATAFMVLGVEKAKQIAQKQSDLDVFLVYEENGALQTYASDGIRGQLQTINQDQ